MLGAILPLLKIVCKYNIDTCLFLIIQFFVLYLSRFISPNQRITYASFLRDSLEKNNNVVILYINFQIFGCFHKPFFFF